MPYLYEYDNENYATLLASQVLDASKGALFGTTGLQPDTTNRTILIGVGGTGVRTIDYVKGALNKRLDPSWKKYVGFLGIDSSWTEFDGASYLDPAESLQVTKNGVADRMKNPATYPSAVRRFMLEDEQLGSLSSDGAGRTRLVGKVKVHDQAPGGMGVDEEIVSRLITLKSSTLEPLPSNTPGSYQVYVIGSVCGGTCSGSFLEMPALIRQAIPNKVKVNAMLYLPDTLARLDPQNESQLFANGYASLKELNYYMGMYMRGENYPEIWPYNSKATPELVLKSTIAAEGFIDVPYLIGTTNGAAADASQVAMETIAEFLISLLAKISVEDGGVFLTSAFESNATAAAKVGNKLTLPGYDGREATSEFHEFPKRFAAIGFAEASAPQKLVRAYTVGKVCQMAGIKPVTANERASAEAAGAGMIVPFRGEDDLLNATEGTAKAKAILAPIEKILGIIHSGNFSFAEDLQETDITWKKIKDSTYDHTAIAGKTDMIIKNRTNPDMMEDIRKRIKKAYAEYRKNVQDYVRKEGPFAFVNLYNGRFIPVGEEYGIGIGRMIQNLIDGKLVDGKAFGWRGIEAARNDLDMIRRTITETAPGLLGIETGKHKDQTSQWVAAYNNWAKARINDVRRETALGAHGALHENFQVPAAKLAQEVGAFGHVLVNLVGIYQNHGKKMETYEAFSTAQDNKTEVNLAAVNTSSYNWLKTQAEGTLASLNAHNLRDNLIDNFFEIGDDNIPNSQKWLEVPKQRVTTNTNGEVSLTVPDVAIPAREIFDKYLADSFPTTLDVSIETMFTQLQANGVSYDNTAHAVLSQLVARSQPHFNGDIPSDSMFSYIMFPSSLQTSAGEGPAIAEAIKNAANIVSPGVQVYASENADSIMFYQMAAPMEIYRLADLAKWENHYENGDFGIKNKEAYLHGYSPDIVVEAKAGEASKVIPITRWADYPSIVRQKGDPRKADPETGKISREGQLRLELDKLIEKAKTLGVLYSEQTADGWIIKRVHCNKSIQWHFDLMECQQDPTTGMLPLGKPLAEAVATQNGKALEDISRKVYLALGGLMGKAHETEALAWEFAARTLRAHMPMSIEIRETVKKFEAWSKDIIEFNKNIMKQFLPAKMVYMLKARTVRQNGDGTWVYMQPNGTPKTIAALTEVMKKFLPPKDKYLVENGLLGYYLFTKLSATLNTSDTFDEAYNRAKTTLEQLANDGEIEALTKGEEQAAAILAEREALAEKGARLDGDTAAEPREMFIKAMGAALDKEKLKEIDLFYFRLGLWEVI